MNPQNKPDWADAPEWAQWLCMDKLGEWHFHYCEPEPQGWQWLSGGRFIETGCREPHDNIPHPWWTMLERRP